MTITYLANSTFIHDAYENVCGPDSTGRFYAIGSVSTFVGPWKCERYDPATGAWTTIADLPATRYLTNGAWTIDSSDRLIYATGGVIINYPTVVYGASNNGYMYDPASNSWTTITALPVGQARQRAHFWTESGMLHIAGGYVPTGTAADDGTAAGTTFTNTWRYSGGSAGTWTNLSAAMNYSHSIVDGGYKSPRDSQGRIYAIGHAIGSGGNITSSERWNPITQTWQTIAALPVVKGAYNWAVTPSDDIHVAQGVSTPATLVKTHYRYNTALDTWSTLAAHPLNSIDGAGFYGSGHFFTIGGFSGNSTIYAYNSATDTWCPTLDVLQSGTPFDICPISNGAGAFFILEKMLITGVNPRSLDLYSPSTPDPCFAAARGRSWAQII